MEEEILDSVEEEVATPELESDDSTQAESEAQEQISQKEEEQERNWRAMRQRQKEIEEDNRRKDEFIAQLMQAQKQKQPAPVEEKEEPIDPDEYANYNGVQKVTKKTVQPLEEKITKLEAMLAKQEQEKKIADFKAKYPDFDDVVNVETLELLEKEEPELAFDITQLKDPFKMGFQSYKLIKALGLADKVPNARRVKEIDKKIEKNSKAVQSPQAYDKRPMAKAFKTTAADQKRLYEEMMHYASQASGL